MFGLDGRELRFAIVISSSHLLQHFLMRLVPPLIPVLAVALEYPLWQLGLLVSIYTFGGGITQAPVGVLSDRYDRLYILPTGIVVAGVSYVLFAAAPLLESVVPELIVRGYTFEGGFVVMSLAMVGVGMGAAVVHPTAYPLISANVRAGNKGKVLGAFGSFAKVGGAVAPLTIGVLIIVLAWEQIVALLGAVCIAAGVGLFVVLRDGDFETAPVEHGSDEDEADGTTEDDEIDGEDGDDRGADETPPDDADPGGDRRTYLYPLAVIYVFFITKMFATNGLNAFVPAFVVGVYAYSLEVGGTSFGPESVANFYFATLFLSAAVSQLVVGGFTDRYDARSIILTCLGVATVGLVVLAVADLSPLALLVVLVVLGASIWGTNPGRDALISDISPPEREGRTFGYIWTAVQLTSAAIPVLVGYTIEAVGFRDGFLLLSVGTIMAFGSICLLFLDRVYVASPDVDSSVDAEPSD